MHTLTSFDQDHRTREPLFIARDPRFLIITFALIIVAGLVVGSTPGLLVLLGYVLILHFLAGLGFAALLRNLRQISLFIVLIVGVNLFFVKGSPLPAPFGFLSAEGLTRGVFYSLRVLVLYVSTWVCLGVGSRESFAIGLLAILKPLSARMARQAAVYCFLTIGFLPLFFDELRGIRLAQSFRGGGMHGRTMAKIAGVRLIVVPLIVSAIRRAGLLAMAVELRGIRETIGHLLVLGKPRPRDYIFGALTVLIVAAAFVTA